MDLELLFSLSGSLAMAGWLALAAAVLTGWRWPRRWLAGLGVPLVLSLLYAALIAGFFGTAEGGFGSLADVARLFASREVLLAGWVHYLAFDLLVGCVLAEAGAAAGVPRLLMLPILALTLFLGPIGFLAFHALRPIVALRPMAEVAGVSS